VPTVVGSPVIDRWSAQGCRASKSGPDQALRTTTAVSAISFAVLRAASQLCSDRADAARRRRSGSSPLRKAGCREISIGDRSSRRQQARILCARAAHVGVVFQSYALWPH